MKRIKKIDERIALEQGQVYKQGFLLAAIGYFVCSLISAFHDAGYLVMDSWFMVVLIVVLFKMARRGVLFAESETLPPIAWKLSAGYAALNGLLVPAAFFFIGKTSLQLEMEPFRIVSMSITLFLIIFVLLFTVWMLLLYGAFRISLRKRREQELRLTEAEQESL